MLFSERVATLNWLRRELPARLRLRDDAFAVLHGGLPDDQQQQVVGDFQLADRPVRVLITGDVASEGVNLHKQCHHLVHVDIPWSLIRIEQRNGRIDRYGQLHPPRIVALALTTSDERFSGDVRVLTRLLAKEHAAHTALGDAASLLKLHDVEREEDAVRRALESGASLDDVVPDPAIARRARSGRRLRGTLRRARGAGRSGAGRGRPRRGCSTARSTSCASASTRRSPTRRPARRAAASAGPSTGPRTSSSWCRPTT